MKKFLMVSCLMYSVGFTSESTKNMIPDNAETPVITYRCNDNTAINNTKQTFKRNYSSLKTGVFNAPISMISTEKRQCTNPDLTKNNNSSLANVLPYNRTSNIMPILSMHTSTFKYVEDTSLLAEEYYNNIEYIFACNPNCLTDDQKKKYREYLKFYCGLRLTEVFGPNDPISLITRLEKINTTTLLINNGLSELKNSNSDVVLYLITGHRFYCNVEKFILNVKLYRRTLIDRIKIALQKTLIYNQLPINIEINLIQTLTNFDNSEGLLKDIKAQFDFFYNIIPNTAKANTKSICNLSEKNNERIKKIFEDHYTKICNTELYSILFGKKIKKT